MTAWSNVLRKTRFDLPRFIESDLVTEQAEDWSRVRSPSRARRRMKRGFPQNVRHYRKPACFLNTMDNTYYIHPELMDRALERAFLNPQYMPLYPQYSFNPGS